MTWAAQMQGDAAAMIVAGAPFVESIEYHPRDGSGRLPRTVPAIVDRESPQSVAGMGAGLAPLMTVIVRNDPLQGIASNEIDTGGDQIVLAAREGGEAVAREIAGIVRHDSGVMVLELR